MQPDDEWLEPPSMTWDDYPDGTIMREPTDEEIYNPSGRQSVDQRDEHDPTL